MERATNSRFHRLLPYNFHIKYIYIMKSFGRCFAYGMHLMGTFKPYFLNSTYLIAILFDFHLRQMLRQFIAVQLFHLKFLFSSMSKHSIHFTIKATRVFKKFIKRDEKRLENICQIRFKELWQFNVSINFQRFVFQTRKRRTTMLHFHGNITNDMQTQHWCVCDLYEW